MREESGIKQSLPEGLRVFSDAQIQKLAQYKHSGAKTAYESFMSTGPLYWAEQQLPAFMSPNFITIMGSLPLQLLVIATLVVVGPNITEDNPLPNWIMFSSGLALCWFTNIDMMDGNRARRLKAGSPLGRFVDECGDTITIANYNFLVAYSVCLGNKWSELAYVMMNFTFFMQETRYIIEGGLVLSYGDFGAVETEVGLSILLMFFGIYGNDCMQSTIGQAIGVDPNSKCPLHMVCGYTWLNCLDLVFKILVFIFVYDSMAPIIAKDVKRTIFYSVPAFACVFLFLGYTTLPSYSAQKGIVILVVNYAQANLTFDLMAHNMSGRPFTYFSPVLPLLVIPLIAYHGLGVTAEFEILLTKVIAGLLLAYFMTKMTILAWQWGDHSGKPFWYLPSRATANETEKTK